MQSRQHHPWRAFPEAVRQHRKLYHYLPAPSLPHRPGRRTDSFEPLLRIVIVIVLVGMNFSVKASDALSQPPLSQSSAGTNNSAAISGTPSEEAAADDPSREYRLAPGDDLTIVVFDQPQLSGNFVVDGRGEVLLPLAGSVGVSGLSLAEAQQRIQQRFADGVLVQPAVIVRMSSYRPVFVTGYVKRAGSYPFIFGETVKAAIATAGGEGQAIEQPLSVAVSDFITAEERVRQLERNEATLLVRKARLEAQRDGRENFVMPLPVGLDRQGADFEQIYSTENDVFERLAGSYRQQVQTLEGERPLIQAAIDAVTDQIVKQKERLAIVSNHLDDLEILYGKGYVTKVLLLNQRIEKTLVEAQLSSLQAEVARLRQNMSELEVKLGDLKAGYEKQILEELQETRQRLRDIETSLAPARQVLDVKAEAATKEIGDTEYAVFISRPRDGGMVTFRATQETTLLPGDVVDVKLTRRSASPLSTTEAMEYLGVHPASSIAAGASSNN